MGLWATDLNIEADWHKVELRPLVTFKVTLLKGRAEMCFGLFSCYHNATPRSLTVGEERYSATAEYERFLYLRGKGRVRVEEVKPA